MEEINQRDVNIHEIEPNKVDWDRYIAGNADPDEMKKKFIEWKTDAIIGNEYGARPRYFSNEEMKSMLMVDLTRLSKMTVQKYTLYKKYIDIKKLCVSEIPEDSKALSFFGYDEKTGISDNATYGTQKQRIWIPKSPEDYLDLEPEVFYTEKTSLLSEQWTNLRTFTHSQINNPNIGRDLRFVVNDKKTSKHLGIICISSDFMDLTGRDNWIGWSREIKSAADNGMINHTAIGSTLAPTQPLGFNFLGGKLIALLAISNIISDQWKKSYGKVLAGLTTTSLYGTYSQYTGLKHWIHRMPGKLNGKKHPGFCTNGSIKFEPEKETLKNMREWLKYNYPLRYYEWYVACKKSTRLPGGQIVNGLPLKRDHRQRSLAFVYKILGIENKYIEAKHSRGVFFCPFYSNTREFLRTGEGVEESDLTSETRLFDNSVESLTELWKEKYAKKRVKRLLETGQYNTNILFYDDMINMSWEEAKEKYLKELGKGK
jgi:hypothetical protein